MKSTAYFTRTILTYLEQRASEDPLFAEAFANPDKDIDRCCTYILNQVQQSGCNGFHDDEIFGIAVHYFLEKDIEAGNPIDCQIHVNHVIELSAEEKEEAHRKAIQQAQDEAYKKMTQPTRKAKKVALNPQPSLFDF
jgi:ribosome-associated translation inhibitor RaiA